MMKFIWQLFDQTPTISISGKEQGTANRRMRHTLHHSKFLVPCSKFKKGRLVKGSPFKGQGEETKEGC